MDIKDNVHSVNTEPKNDGSAQADEATAAVTENGEAVNKGGSSVAAPAVAGPRVKLTRKCPYVVGPHISSSILKGTPKPVITRKPPLLLKDKPKIPLKPNNLLLRSPSPHSLSSCSSSPSPTPSEQEQQPPHQTQAETLSRSTAGALTSFSSAAVTSPSSLTSATSLSSSATVTLSSASVTSSSLASVTSSSASVTSSSAGSNKRSASLVRGRNPVATPRTFSFRLNSEQPASLRDGGLSLG
jgi:hypothetical protein